MITTVLSKPLKIYKVISRYTHEGDALDKVLARSLNNNNSSPVPLVTETVPTIPSVDSPTNTIAERLHKQLEDIQRNSTEQITRISEEYKAKQMSQMKEVLDQFEDSRSYKTSNKTVVDTQEATTVMQPTSLTETQKALEFNLTVKPTPLKQDNISETIETFRETAADNCVPNSHPGADILRSNIETDTLIRRVTATTQRGCEAVSGIAARFGEQLIETEEMTRRYNVALERLRRAVATSNTTTIFTYGAIISFIGYIGYNVIVNRQLPNFLGSAGGIIGSLFGGGTGGASHQSPTTNVYINNPGTTPQATQSLPLSQSQSQQEVPNQRFSLDTAGLRDTGIRNPSTPVEHNLLSLLSETFANNPFVSSASVAVIWACIKYLKK